MCVRLVRGYIFGAKLRNGATVPQNPVFFLVERPKT